MSNVTPLRPGTGRSGQELTAFENAFSKARGIVDVLHDLASRGGLDGGPHVSQSIGWALASVLDLLDEASAAIIPKQSEDGP